MCTLFLLQLPVLVEIFWDYFLHSTAIIVQACPVSIYFSCVSVTLINVTVTVGCSFVKCEGHLMNKLQNDISLIVLKI